MLVDGLGLMVLPRIKTRQRSYADTIERFLEVDEILEELHVVLQMFFHQQPKFAYLFDDTPL